MMAPTGAVIQQRNVVGELAPEAAGVLAIALLTADEVRNQSIDEIVDPVHERLPRHSMINHVALSGGISTLTSTE